MGIDILDVLSPHRPFAFVRLPPGAKGPGMEHTLPDARPHYTLPACRLQHSLPVAQLHQTVPKEDALV